MSSSFSFITRASPTGIVPVAAASASLALRVLKGVLEVAARKHPAEELAGLIDSAGREAENLAHLAQQDGEVYAAYVQARRERSANLHAALQRAIESPLAAARSTVAGIDLCRNALPFFKGAIAADVGGAAVLLAGAVSALLCCVKANLGAVEDETYAHWVEEERHALARRAINESQSVLESVHC
jgi:formiminotetrahydrofolate cyclodeaminase